MHRKKEKRNPRSQELIQEMIELSPPQTIKDIQEMLKDMFADTMEDIRTVWASGSAKMRGHTAYLR